MYSSSLKSKALSALRSCLAFDITHWKYEASAVALKAFSDIGIQTVDSTVLSSEVMPIEPAKCAVALKVATDIGI